MTVASHERHVVTSNSTVTPTTPTPQPPHPTHKGPVMREVLRNLNVIMRTKFISSKVLTYYDTGNKFKAGASFIQAVYLSSVSIMKTELLYK